jgi:hypothetical protein
MERELAYSTRHSLPVITHNICSSIFFPLVDGFSYLQLFKMRDVSVGHSKQLWKLQCVVLYKSSLQTEA